MPKTKFSLELSSLWITDMNYLKVALHYFQDVPFLTSILNKLPMVLNLATQNSLTITQPRTPRNAECILYKSMCTSSYAPCKSILLCLPYTVYGTDNGFPQRWFISVCGLNFSDHLNGFIGFLSYALAVPPVLLFVCGLPVESQKYTAVPTQF